MVYQSNEYAAILKTLLKENPMTVTIEPAGFDDEDDVFLVEDGDGDFLDVPGEDEDVAE